MSSSRHSSTAGDAYKKRADKIDSAYHQLHSCQAHLRRSARYTVLHVNAGDAIEFLVALPNLEAQRYRI